MPKKFIKSLKYAQAGAEHALKTQRNLWVHFFIGLLALSAALGLNAGLMEMAVLTMAIFAVIVSEMFNTALEELVNILSPEKQPAAGLVKNIAAAAVLTSALGAVLVGGLIIGPKVVGLL